MNKLLLALLLLLPMAATADLRNGSFTAPTQRADNTPLAITEIGGFNVYVDGVLDTDVSPVSPLDTTFVLSRPPGTYTLVMTTFDTENRVSVDSILVVFTIPVTDTANPNAPAGIIITVPPVGGGGRNIKTIPRE